MDFKELDKIAHNAVRKVKKTHSFTGSMTDNDLKQTAWLGITSAINQPKFDKHPNKQAYLFVFATGYIRHALHRKSRMIKVPWETLKENQSGYAHLSYSWENLPEPSIQEPSFKLKDTAVTIAETFSKSDKTKILNGDFTNLSHAGKQLLAIIKGQYNCIDDLYE
jgi:hypothetical protein